VRDWKRSDEGDARTNYSRTDVDPLCRSLDARLLHELLIRSQRCEHMEKRGWDARLAWIPSALERKRATREVEPTQVPRVISSRSGCHHSLRLR